MFNLNLVGSIFFTSTVNEFIFTDTFIDYFHMIAIIISIRYANKQNNTSINKELSSCLNISNKMETDEFILI